MRLLQLALDADDDTVLELHPMFTVVRGLDEFDRQRLVRVIAAIADGEDPQCGGSIEAHGVVMELTQDSLGMLDAGGEIDPVVRRRDLPGAVPSLFDAGPDVEAVDVDERDAAAIFLANAPRDAYPELDKVRQRRRDTREAVAVLRFAAEQAARDLDAAGRDRRAASERLDAATVRAASPPGPEHRRGPAALEVTALQEELDAIDAGIIELEGIDERPIAVLLDAIENPDPVEEVPSPRAQELADRFAALQLEVASLEERMEAEGRGPASVMRRLDESRAALLAAERAAKRADIGPDDEADLAAAHERVLEAERKASGLRSRSGQRKLAEALAVQQDILDRIGYPTWSAFVMGARVMGTDPAAQERLDLARQEQADAEQEWAEVSARMEDDPDHHALLDQLEEVEIEAVSLLLERGVPVPDERLGLESTLREVREPKEDVTTGQLVDALAFHLETIGLALDAGSRTEEQVTAVARAFLAEADGIAERIEELTTERRRHEARLADARSRAEAEAWEALEASVDGPMPEPEPTLAELEEALEVITETETEFAEILEGRNALLDAALTADRRAADRALVVAEQVITAADLDPREVVTSYAGQAGTVYAARPGWSEIDAEAIEFYLLARLAAQRQVSYAGSAPMIIDDALAGVPETDVRRILDGLGRMAESVQIVYVSDDPVVIDWAQQRPDDAVVTGRLATGAESPV